MQVKKHKYPMPDNTAQGRKRLTAGFLAAILCLLTCWGSIAFGGTGSERVRVKVRSEGQIIGEEILLKDISEIEAPAAVKEKIASFRIESAPLPGKKKKISGRRISAMVASAKLLPENAEITVPESIEIERAVQSVPAAMLGQIFERYISEALSGSQFNVRDIKIRGSNQFPAGRLSLTVRRRGKQELMGNTNLQVRVRVDGKECGHLTLSGWVDRYKPVVHVARPVANHSILTASDILLKTVNISGMAKGVVTDPAEAIGKAVRMALRPGIHLRAGMLTAPPLVQKGDRVKIIANSDGLKVSTMGVAKGPGRLGEQIKVENPVSNKVVVGRVTGEATVEVLF